MVLVTLAPRNRPTQRANNTLLVPAIAAPIAADKTVTHGETVPIELSAAAKKKFVCCTAIDVLLFHPDFIERRSRASGYRCPYGGRVSSTNRVSTLPSFLSGLWAPPLPRVGGESGLALHLGRWLVFVRDFSFCFSRVLYRASVRRVIRFFPEKSSQSVRFFLAFVFSFTAVFLRLDGP